MTKITEGMIVSGRYFPSGTNVDEINRFEAQQYKPPQEIVLQKPAVVNGTMLSLGTKVYISDENLEKAYREAEKMNVRRSISATAGSESEVLGTVSDATGLLMYFMARLVLVINNSNDFSQLKNTLSSSELLPIAQEFITKLESGEIKLPPLIKGQQEVVNEIQQRFTKIANVFAAR